MGWNTEELSKAVSHALRHEPWLYELELDEEGWVSVESLLAALRRQHPTWSSLEERDLARMIEASNKRRHEIREGRIRAIYGHSVAGKFKRKLATPPKTLYHGTSPSTVAVIRHSGLLPMGRQYVHLSTDQTTAIMVGRRKANNPTILIIQAAKAHDKGVTFYEGNSQVWLADAVPPEFIELGD